MPRVVGQVLVGPALQNELGDGRPAGKQHAEEPVRHAAGDPAVRSANQANEQQHDAEREGHPQSDRVPQRQAIEFLHLVAAEFQFFAAAGQLVEPFLDLQPAA
jgi:hypothetical protein